MPTLMTLAVDLLILAGLFCLGLVLARLVLGRLGLLEAVSLSFPLGAGVFTWLLFLLSWAGMPLRGPTVLLTFAVALVAPLWAMRIRQGNRGLGEVPIADRPRERLPDRALMVSLLLFLPIMGSLAVARAHSQWDGAAGWIIKGYGIAMEGDIRAGATWGAWGLAYPLNISLQAMLFRLFSGDLLPGSMLIFPLYGASLVAGVYRFWGRRAMLGWRGLAGAVFLLTNPFFLLHSSIPYANLPTAAYVVLATSWIIDGLAEDNAAGLTVGSLLFGLAGWTRPEAVSYGLLVMPSLVLLFRISRKRWPLTWRTILPFAVVVGAWFAFGWTAVETSHLGGAVRGVFPKLRAGEYRLFELYLIPRLLSKRAFDPEIWGYLFPVAGMLWLVSLPRLFRRTDAFEQVASVLATAIVSAIPMAIFYVRAFTRQGDFFALLNRSFDRAFLPAAAMLLLTGFLLFSDRAGMVAAGPRGEVVN